MIWTGNLIISHSCFLDFQLHAVYYSNCSWTSVIFTNGKRFLLLTWGYTCISKWTCRLHSLPTAIKSSLRHFDICSCKFSRITFCKHSGMKTGHYSQEILLVLHDSGNLPIPHFGINFLLKVFQEKMCLGIILYSTYSLMKVHTELTLNLHSMRDVFFRFTTNFK